MFGIILTCVPDTLATAASCVSMASSMNEEPSPDFFKSLSSTSCHLLSLSMVIMSPACTERAWCVPLDTSSLSVLVMLPETLSLSTDESSST